MTLWTGLQSQLLTSTQTSRRTNVSPTSALYPLPTFAKEYQNKQTHLLSLSTIKKSLNKFLQYFHVAKKLLLKQPSPLTFKSYITLDFLMVPRTVKFISRNGIKTHPEMEKKKRGEKSSNIGSSSSKEHFIFALYTPIRLCPGNGMEVGDTNICYPQSRQPCSSKQGLQPRDQHLLSSTSICKEITTDSSFHLFSTWLSLRHNQSTAYLTWAGLLSSSLH